MKTLFAVILLIGPADIFVLAHMGVISAKLSSLWDNGQFARFGGGLLLVQRFLLIAVPAMGCVCSVLQGVFKCPWVHSVCFSFFLIGSRQQTTTRSRKSKQELSKQTISITKGAIRRILRLVPGKVYCGAVCEENLITSSGPDRDLQTGLEWRYNGRFVSHDYLILF